MDDNTVDSVVEDSSLARNRSRRTKSDKTGRLAALQRLQKAKQSGERLTYEVKDEAYVYEEVDEETYSKIVRDRQEDDWIVDDDGSGYVEDGRDIFDDEEQKGSSVPQKGKKGASEKRKKNANIRAPDSKPKNIRSMFAAAAVKTKPKVEKDVNLNEDALLGDIMAELHNSGASAVVPAPVKLKKKTPSRPAFNPFSTKVTPKKSAAKLLTPRNINNDMANRAKKPKVEHSQRPALDNLESEPQILEYETQDFADALDENMPMEEELINETKKEEEPVTKVETKTIDTNESMAVDDINFDDDMEAEVQLETKKVPKSEEIPEMTGWENAEKGEMDVPVDVQVDSSQLPLTTNEKGEQVLRMFWMDAYEDQYKQPGTVYLFGKVWIESAKTHVSSCVAIRNIQRRIFILPRKFKYNKKTKMETSEPVAPQDVYKEFAENIAERYNISSFKSKVVTKEYAFEKIDVPAESDYIEVHYSAEFKTLPMDLQGETFSHVFSTNTSSLELFLLDRKMKGPSWIDIKVPQIPNPAVSWCKVEAFVNTPGCVSVTSNPPSPPPFVVMTLNLLTMPNPKTHQNEVLGAACLVQHKFYADKGAPKPHFQQHFCAISKPNDCVFPYDFREKVQKKGSSMKVEVMMTERALLGFLLAKIHKIDPDVIMGHDVFAFDLEVLLHRIEQNKVPHWSRIGRLKRANMPRFGGKGRGGRASTATSGRLVTDVMISAKELIRCRSYDLTELVSHVLKEKREEIDMDLITTYYNSSKTLLQLVEYTLMDANFALRIMYDLMVLPLALSITNICGNVMSRTLLGGRAERNEYLLLHAFTEKNFIVPDKTYGKKPEVDAEREDEDGNTTMAKRTGKKKPAYEGGLVLEPKKGFYDKFILLLDFNSLYPSIIQEYNICFTTITRSASQNEDSENQVENIEIPDQDLDPGILPTEIRKLVQSRRQVKQLMKKTDISSDLLMQYDIRQKALKLTANSMYGCLGFTFSRFYAKPLAALVTGKGREILMKTKDLVETMNLEVIYGDTDSIMINTNSTDLDEVFKLGNKVKNEVNKLYKLLEIDIDGVFKSMLLLKKKKYAALTVTKQGDNIVTAQELKGLDIVRRDWCMLAKEAGNFAVSQILSGESRETIVENIHSKLLEVGEQVKEGKLPVELYHITKSLTKNPEDYPDKKSLPHVQVALRLNSKGGRKTRAGDTIYYVICEDGSNLPASQRAYHPDELEKADNLKIDTKYYLAHQVHPVVSRLCDPIDGTDAAHIAECLGLDPSGYRQAMARSDQHEDEAMLGGAAVSDEERYKDCDRLKVPCPACSKQIIVDSVFMGVDNNMTAPLTLCNNASCSEAPIAHTKTLMNLITRVIREHIKKYYEGWLHCDDSACGMRTRNVPQIFNRGYPLCPQCRKNRLQPEYTDCALYTQLCFYQHLFDVERALSNIPETTKRHASFTNPTALYAEQYKKVKWFIEKQIKQCAYSEVNLTRLFEGLFNVKSSTNKL